MKLAGFLLCVLVSVGHAARAADIQVIERAEILASPDQSIPAGDELWKPVALPHNWYRDRVLTAPRVWYRMQVMGDKLRIGHSIFFSRAWVQEMEIYVNGKQIWRTPYDLPPDGIPFTAQLAVIPPGLLQTGANTIHLRVKADSASFHGVPRIHFGETRALREKASVSRVLQYRGIINSMRVLGVLGVLALVFWLWTRPDPALFWYGVTGIASFVLCELWYEAFLRGGTTFWQNAFSAIRFNGYLMPVLIMNLRLAGKRHLRYEAVLWLVFLAAVAGVAVPHQWRDVAVAASAFVFLSVAALSVLVLLKGRQPLGRPSTVALLLGNIVAVLLYAHEPGMQFGWIGIDRPRLSVYAPAAFMLAALALVIQPILARVRAVRARLRQTEQERALAEQRRRIMADMHDGLGARLVALLSMAQSGKVEPKELCEGIAVVLDELRLAIDAVEPVEGDVSVILGSVRHRMRSVLETAGVRLVWNVSELPAIQDLTPQRILAIQRMLLEVFTNIIKHSGAGTVSVSTARLPNAVEIAIEDDGRGFGDEMPNAGHGLGNLKMRSAEAGCTVRVVSAVGKGTRVAITLPAHEEPSSNGRGEARPASDNGVEPVLGMSHQRSSA